MDRIDFYRRDHVETSLFEPEAQPAHAGEDVDNRGPGHEAVSSRTRTRRRVRPW